MPVDITEGLNKVRESGEFKDLQVTKTASMIDQILNNINKFLEDMATSFKEWLKDILPQVNLGDNPAFSNIFSIIGIVLIIIILIILGFILFKLVEHYRKKEKEEYTSAIKALEGKIDASNWMEKARIMALEGNYREACRSVYMAVIFYLDEKGLIKYDKAKTNLEYLQTIRNDKELHTPMKRLVSIFENLWYGKQLGSNIEYDECINLYKKVTNE